MSIQIVMPRAGLTMVEGTISAWKVPEGSQVNKGDVVMTYENEKNAIDYEIVHGGYLHIIAAQGDTVQVGETIAYVAETREAYDALVSGTTAAPPLPPPALPGPTAPAAAVTVRDSANRVRASGLARKMARESGIPIECVPPTGGDGTRVVARDVTDYLKAVRQNAGTDSMPAAEQEEITRIPWTGIRKTIARNMFDSLHNSAQCTSVCEVDVTKLLELRQALAAQREFLDCRITVNDLLCMAVVKMLQRHPLVNGTFDGSTLCTHKQVHLSVAVATENGLMVPVVRHADAMTLTELSRAIKDLGTRARERKLTEGEQSGGTFTVSNVGMFPTDFATPIINPPEVAIMGFGRTSRKPVYVDAALMPRDMMYAYLTFDHRVIDGLEVGRIFQDLQTLLENPALITA